MRQNWKFKYAAADVADAASAKRDHHAERLAWWDRQQQALIAEIREKGLEVEESMSAVYASSAAPHGARLVVKDDYQTKLNECHMKIKLHSAKTRKYDGWVQFLSIRTEAIELDCDDYLFFYGD